MKIICIFASPWFVSDKKVCTNSCNCGCKCASGSSIKSKCWYTPPRSIAISPSTADMNKRLLYPNPFWYNSNELLAISFILVTNSRAISSTFSKIDVSKYIPFSFCCIFLLSSCSLAYCWALEYSPSLIETNIHLGFTQALNDEAIESNLGSINPISTCWLKKSCSIRAKLSLIVFLVFFSSSFSNRVLFALFSMSTNSARVTSSGTNSPLSI